MKLRALATTLAFGVAASLAAPAHAQLPDPCTVYLCMAGISGSGSTGGPVCIAPIAFWHMASPAGLAVWGPYGFIPPASYALREAYLTACPGSSVATNEAVLQSIMTEWGSEP